MEQESLEGLKILVVDDEKDIGEILVDALNILGAECMGTHNGEDAFSIYQQTEDLDVIITDLRMPKMDGKELTQKIRSGGDTIPIICMSGYSVYEEEEAYGWGASAFLSKPANMNKILSTIKELTKNKKKAH